MLRDDSATGTAPGRSDGETAHKKSGSAARARSVATAPRLTRARTVATGLSAVVQPADVSDVLAASFSGALRSHGSPPLRVSSWTKSPSVSPSLVARFHPHSSLFLHTLSPSLSLFRAFSLHADRFNVPSVQRSPDADSHDGGFPSQKTSTAARALLRGGR